MIEAIAMKIGTSARNDANTKASTSSAPRPPSSASSSTPGPSSPPLSLLERVEAGEVDRRAADRRAAQRRARPASRPAGCRRTAGRGRASG